MGSNSLILSLSYIIELILSRQKNTQHNDDGWSFAMGRFADDLSNHARPLLICYHDTDVKSIHKTPVNRDVSVNE
jgi:hypothetical protein